MKRHSIKLVLLLGSMSICGQAVAMDFARHDPKIDGYYARKSANSKSQMGPTLGDSATAHASLGSLIRNTFSDLASHEPPDHKTDRMTTGSVKSGVFNSVAIAFSGIASQPQWQHAFQSLKNSNIFECGGTKQCRKNQGKISKVLLEAQKLGFSQKLTVVNRQINDLISYKSDQSNYYKADYWALPQESLRRGRGDCEDYVILKLALLQKLGVPVRSMSMVVLKDKIRNLYHAVLAVSTNKGTFILDNVHRNVLLDRQLPHYQPLYSFSENRSWIHGRRITSGKYIASRDSDYRFAKILPGESTSQVQLELQGFTKIDLSELRPTIAN